MLCYKPTEDKAQANRWNYPEYTVKDKWRIGKNKLANA
jgi:hypothetical protein